MQLGICLPARHSSRFKTSPAIETQQSETPRLQNHQVIEMWLIPIFQRLISLCAVSDESKLRQVASTAKSLITPSPPVHVPKEIVAGKKDVTYNTGISQLVLCCVPTKHNDLLRLVVSDTRTSSAGLQTRARNNVIPGKEPDTLSCDFFLHTDLSHCCCFPLMLVLYRFSGPTTPTSNVSLGSQWYFWRVKEKWWTSSPNANWQW